MVTTELEPKLTVLEFLELVQVTPKELLLARYQYPEWNPHSNVVELQLIALSWSKQVAWCPHNHNYACPPPRFYMEDGGDRALQVALAHGIPVVCLGEFT